MQRNDLALLLAGLSLVGATGCMDVSEKAQSGTHNVNKSDLENNAKLVLLDKGVEHSAGHGKID